MNTKIPLKTIAASFFFIGLSAISAKAMDEGLAKHFAILQKDPDIISIIQGVKTSITKIESRQDLSELDKSAKIEELQTGLKRNLLDLATKNSALEELSNQNQKASQNLWAPVKAAEEACKRAREEAAKASLPGSLAKWDLLISRVAQEPLPFSQKLCAEYKAVKQKVEDDMFYYCPVELEEDINLIGEREDALPANIRHVLGL